MAFFKDQDTDNRFDTRSFVEFFMDSDVVYGKTKNGDLVSLYTGTDTADANAKLDNYSDLVFGDELLPTATTVETAPFPTYIVPSSGVACVASGSFSTDGWLRDKITIPADAREAVIGIWGRAAITMDGVTAPDEDSGTGFMVLGKESSQTSSSVHTITVRGYNNIDNLRFDLDGTNTDVWVEIYNGSGVIDFA